MLMITESKVSNHDSLLTQKILCPRHVLRLCEKKKLICCLLEICEINEVIVIQINSKK